MVAQQPVPDSDWKETCYEDSGSGSFLALPALTSFITPCTPVMADQQHGMTKLANSMKACGDQCNWQLQGPKGVQLAFCHTSRISKRHGRQGHWCTPVHASL